MCLLQAQMSFTRLCWGKFERPAGDLTNPQRAHELKARQPIEALRVPFPQRWVLRRLSDDWVLHYRIAEMVNHRSDGEAAAKSFVQALLGILSSLQRQRQRNR